MYLELFGVLFMLLYLLLELKQKPAMWVVGFFGSLAYVTIFYRHKFYADMCMNIYYLLISIYGLYAWKLGKKAQEGGGLPVSRLTLRQSVPLIVLALALFLSIAYALKTYTDSPVPLGDALTTALSVVATWMLARKILEHWLLWILINFASAALYLYKDIYLTAALFILYGALSIYGYFQWKKTLPSPKSET